MNQNVLSDSLWNTLDLKALYVVDDKYILNKMNNEYPVLKTILPEEEIPEALEYTSIYGVGNSAAINRAKIIAFQYNKPLVAVPTSLSNSSFSTSKALDKGELVFAKLPDTVLFDTSILDRTQSVLGFMRLMTIYDALVEWSVFRAEVVQEDYFMRARSLLVKAINVFSSGTELQEANLFAMLMEYGHIINEYGSRIPVCGTELVFSELASITSKRTDWRIKDTSELMIVGTVVMNFLYPLMSYQGEWYEPVPYPREVIRSLARYRNITVPYDSLFYDVLANLRSVEYDSRIQGRLMPGVEYGISSKVFLYPSFYEELKTWMLENNITLE